MSFCKWFSCWFLILNRLLCELKLPQLIARKHRIYRSRAIQIRANSSFALRTNTITCLLHHRMTQVTTGFSKMFFVKWWLTSRCWVSEPTIQDGSSENAFSWNISIWTAKWSFWVCFMKGSCIVRNFELSSSFVAHSDNNSGARHNWAPPLSIGKGILLPL